MGTNGKNYTTKTTMTIKNYESSLFVETKSSFPCRHIKFIHKVYGSGRNMQRKLK